MTKLFKPLFPILYQGSSRRASGRSGYFEGWYFKQTTNASTSAGNVNRAVSFIPGISRASAGSRDGDGAFVQMIDGASGTTRFFPFSAGEFSASDDPFEVRVGRNRFSLSGLSVDLEDESGRVRAELEYGGTTPPSQPFPWPGVMGPYSFAPFMECYHGIASLDHRVDGYVEIGGGVQGAATTMIGFDDGRGYIEKDWGRSMPRSWLWVQCNTFDAAIGPASFFLSLARVPWLGGWFNGFISILLVGGKEYRFASYTGARVELLTFDGSTVSAMLADRSWKLELTVRRSHEGSLAAPMDGAMNRRISESADSWVRVALKRRHGAADVPVFDAYSPAAEVEVVGDVDSLRP